MMALGTAATLAIGSGVSAVAGASSANKAAKAQKEASEQQIELQRDIFDQQVEMFSPYLESGGNALAAYNYEMGLGELPTIGGYTPEVEEYTIAGTPGTGTPGSGAPQNRLASFTGMGSDDLAQHFATASRGGAAGSGRDGMASRRDTGYSAGTPDRIGYRVDGKTFDTRAGAEAYARKHTVEGTPYEGFKATPGYEFRLKEGLDAVQAGVGARHGLVSGASMKAANQYGQNFASNEYGNYMNRLGGLMGQGQSSAAMTATAGNNYATGAGNALANYGDAAAAGAIGVGNAIQGGINNGIGAWMYGKGQGMF